MLSTDQFIFTEVILFVCKLKMTQICFLLCVEITMARPRGYIIMYTKNELHEYGTGKTYMHTLDIVASVSV